MVPNNLNTFEEVHQLFTDLCFQGEKWNELKLVLLGHGDVGKTTLLHAIRRNLDSWVMQV
jgi:GTPase SAR1 family protein